MQFNVDKRFIEILNTSGVKITWAQFRKANDLRRAERDNDPVAVARKAKARMADDLDIEAYREFNAQMDAARSAQNAAIAS